MTNDMEAELLAKMTEREANDMALFISTLDPFDDDMGKVIIEFFGRDAIHLVASGIIKQLSKEDGNIETALKELDVLYFVAMELTRTGVSWEDYKKQFGTTYADIISQRKEDIERVTNQIRKLFKDQKNITENTDSNFDSSTDSATKH